MFKSTMFKATQLFHHAKSRTKISDITSFSLVEIQFNFLFIFPTNFREDSILGSEGEWKISFNNKKIKRKSRGI